MTGQGEAKVELVEYLHEFMDCVIGHNHWECSGVYPTLQAAKKAASAAKRKYRANPQRVIKRTTLKSIVREQV